MGLLATETVSKIYQKSIWAYYRCERTYERKDVYKADGLMSDVNMTTIS